MVTKATHSLQSSQKWASLFRWQDGQQFERQLVNDFDRWDVHCADVATLCVDDISVVIRQQVRLLLSAPLILVCSSDITEALRHQQC